MVAEIAPLSPATGSVVDLVLGIGVGISILMGLWRGLLKEMLSLIGWGVSYFSAQWWGMQAGTLVPVGEPGSRLNVLAGMILVFVATWMIWALLTWALREMLAATGLGGTDRLLGGLFGLLRGLLVALVVFTLANMTPLTQWAPWQQSSALPWLNTVLVGLRPMLPARILPFLPTISPADSPGDCGEPPCNKEVI
jgi:membrane protein required for colicin V production